MKRLTITTIMIFVSLSFAVSQKKATDEEIKVQLNSADKKSIEKAEQLFNNATAQIKAADETMSGNEKKAYKTKIKASKDLGKANKIFYKVYKQDLKRFFNNIDPVKAKKAELKIEKANVLMKEAKKSRESSLKLNVVENAYQAMEKANKYEEKAINNLREVYGMFIGSSSVVGDERLLVTNDENKIEKSKETETEVEENVAESENVNLDNNTIRKNVRNFTPIKIFGTRGVFFLIQVAASKSPISDDYLRRNYKEDIHGEMMDGWHRYVINQRFGTLEEAENYKANAGVRGALVIAIKNGKKVSMQEALKKEELNLSEMEYAPVGSRLNTSEEDSNVLESQIVYRLQIGISISKLTAAEVRQFKNGGKAVIPVKRGGWYSYTIGDFNSEAEALNFKRIKGLTDASVLKMKDGRVLD
jgi:hypothetical protein